MSRGEVLSSCSPSAPGLGGSVGRSCAGVGRRERHLNARAQQEEALGRAALSPHPQGATQTTSLRTSLCHGSSGGPWWVLGCPGSRPLSSGKAGPVPRPSTGKALADTRWRPRSSQRLLLTQRPPCPGSLGPRPQERGLCLRGTPRGWARGRDTERGSSDNCARAGSPPRASFSLTVPFQAAPPRGHYQPHRVDEDPEGQRGHVVDYGRASAWGRRDFRV